MLGNFQRMDHNSACSHPGCGGVVATKLTYDYAGRTVWLVDPGVTIEHGMGLCQGHSATFRPPVGWVLEDERLPTIPRQPPIAV